MDAAKPKYAIRSVETRSKQETINLLLGAAAVRIRSAFSHRYQDDIYVVPTLSMCKEMWRMHSELNGAIVMSIPDDWTNETIRDRLYGLYEIVSIE